MRSDQFIYQTNSSFAKYNDGLNTHDVFVCDKCWNAVPRLLFFCLMLKNRKCLDGLVQSDSVYHLVNMLAQNH